MSQITVSITAIDDYGNQTKITVEDTDEDTDPIFMQDGIKVCASRAAARAVAALDATRPLNRAEQS